MRRTKFDEKFTPQSTWLDLVNSQQWDGFGRLTDHLLEQGWVARFLRYWRVRPEKIVGTEPITELSEIRVALRQATEKIASGRGINRRDIHALNRFLKTPSYPHLVIKGKQVRIELRPVRLNWAWIKSQIAASFAESLLGHPNRIKICANSGCRWAFHDATKGNIRRWCNDRRCGNRDRVRRARARQSS
jgi:predicted RNA-binding Zn ribbon-like protein